ACAARGSAVDLEDLGLVTAGRIVRQGLPCGHLVVALGSGPVLRAPVAVPVRGPRTVAEASGCLTLAFDLPLALGVAVEVEAVDVEGAARLRLVPMVRLSRRDHVDLDVTVVTRWAVARVLLPTCLLLGLCPGLLIRACLCRRGSFFAGRVGRLLARRARRLLARRAGRLLARRGGRLLLVR